ncbi:MAG: FtsX-like permease family protein [Metamycoplasmataceae bacterium]
MKKLFKEVIKSLANSKVLMICLMILIFLSSSFFTLFSDISKNYSNDFNNYKKVSKVHDLTVDLNIKNNNQRPDKFYLENSSTFYSDVNSANIESDVALSPLILETNPSDPNDKNKYFKISNIIPSLAGANDFYISLEEFYNFLKINPLIFDFINGTVFPTEQIEIKNNIFSQYNFKKFSSPGQLLVGNLFELKTLDSFTSLNNSLGQPLKLSELVTIINNGFRSSDTISGVKNIFVNIETKEASISLNDKKEWALQNVLYIIKSSDVAKFLGFKIKDPRFGIYEVDMNNTISKDAFFKTSINSTYVKLDPNANWNKTFKLSTNNVFSQEIIASQKADPIFNMNNNFFLNKNWIQKKRIINTFLLKLDKLNYDFNTVNEINKAWGGSYLNFINSIKNNSVKKKYFDKNAFWEKKNYIFDADINGQIIDKNKYTVTKAELLNTDLNKEIISSKDPLIKSSILLELKNNDIINFDEYTNIINNIFGAEALSLLNNIKNNDGTIKKVNEINAFVEQNIDSNIFDKIESLIGKDNISLRETMSIKSENSLFNLVNLGNENKELKIGNKYFNTTNVDTLYNEEKNGSNLLFNSSLYFDPTSKTSLQSFTPEIINKIFSGYSLETDYLNPIFYFGNYKFFDSKNNIYVTLNSQKILLLEKKINNVKNFVGITLNPIENKFVLLTSESAPFLNWNVVRNSSFDNTIENLNKLIFDGQWSFAEENLSGKKIKLIGDLGWAIQDKNYSNKFYVPLKILLPSSEIIQDYQNGNGFKHFSDNLENYLTTSLDGIISPFDIKILTDATNQSFTNYGFGNALMPPSILTKNVLLKSVLGIPYHAALYDQKDYLGNLLNSVLNSKKGSVDETLSSLSIIFKNFFNIDINLNELSTKYFVDKNIFFSDISSLISSINVDKFFIEFFESFFNNQNVNNRSIGIGDYLPFILKNTNEFKFKESIKKIIRNINWGNIFKSIYDSLTVEDREIYGNIILQLNGGENYKNVGDGLSELLDYFSLDSFKKLLDKKIVNKEFLIVDENNNEKMISTNTMKLTDLFSSLLVSISPEGDNNENVLNSLIKLLNLSNKTTGFLGVYQPADDPNKIDLYDLTSLNVSKSPEIKKDDDILKELLKKINNGFNINDLTDIEKNVLKKYILIKNENDFLSLSTNELKNRLIYILKIIEQGKLNSFQIDTDSFNSTIPKSLADDFLYLINPKTTTGGFIEKTIKQQIYDQFYGGNKKIKEYDMLPEILNYYNFWLLFSKQSLENGFDAIEQINNLVNLVTGTNNNSIKQILSQKTHEFNKFLLGKAPLLDGFTSTKKIAVELAAETEKQLKNNPNSIWMPEKIIKLFFNVDNLNNVSYNENTFSLVGALTMIMSNNSQEQINLLKNNFVNVFLGQGSVEEKLTRVELALKMQNKLNGNTSNVLENIGLSSSIMSAFSGIINPFVVLWYTINQNATSTSSLGNLQFLLKERLYKINSANNSVDAINFNGFENIINLLYSGPEFIDSGYDPEEIIPLELDFATIQNLYEKFKTIDPNDPLNKVNLKFFGIDINNLISSVLNSFVEERKEENVIVTYNVSSFVAKVSYGYLKQNNKEEFDLRKNINVLNDLDAMEKFINNPINEKFVIDVNGLKYLIIGEDITADFLYPIINTENIQVDSRKQAIVYLNQTGFDRARQSNANSFIEKYLLLRKGNFQKSLVTLKNMINVIVYNAINGTNYELGENPGINDVAFLYNETNPLNPERSLRITTIERMIDLIVSLNFIVTASLLIIISGVIILIIKRFIMAKARVFGILKAQGYSKLQISIALTIIGAVAVTIGGIFGYLLALSLQGTFIGVFSSFWALPVKPISFNIVSFLITIVLPLIMVSALIIVISLIVLRINTISLINESFELNKSKTGEKIKKSIKHTSIKNKFSVSLSINSAMKLFSLLICLIASSSISIFSIASNGGFDKSTNLTYKNRKYKYKIDLTSPTMESGLYSKIELNDEQKTNINNLLFVPTGNPNEGNTYIADYFRPGFSSVINVDIDDPNNPGALIPSNGIPFIGSPHIITKSSLDLTVKSSGININTWNTLFNSLPEAQKVKLLEVSENASIFIEKTQDIIFPTNEDKFARDKITGQKINYFKYIKESNPSDSHFVYKKLNQDQSDYINVKIVIGETDLELKYLRNIYRDFLVNAYNIMFNQNTEIQDFSLLFGGVKFDKDQNETYTWAKARDANNKELKVYGYKENSSYVKITNSNGTNLLNIANDFYIKNKDTKIYPIIINEVAANLRNLSVGKRINLKIENDFKRNLNKLEESINKTNKINNKNITFEIVGINNTYINEEFSTTQNVVNDILELEKNDNQEAFNGIFSNNDNPSIISNSLSLYSESNYWAGDQKIDVDYNSSTATSGVLTRSRNIFKQLFYLNSIDGSENEAVIPLSLKKIDPNFYKDKIIISETIEKWLGFEIDINNDGNLDANEFSLLSNEEILMGLKAFVDIYGSNILNPLIENVFSQDIEVGFILGTSNVMNTITILILAFSLSISMIILILMSTLIINENERNIAIFGILGYSNRDKARMFLSIYFPILLIAILISIPFSIGLISLFTTFILQTSLTLLPISLSAISVLGGSLFVLVIFSMSLLLSWYNVNRIKPILLLKGK